ncbi:MAG: hypothetical protein IPP30_07570 [Flavobacterium sp.]|nr:hypothetical protein [Flavobacterium sp.]
MQRRCRTKEYNIYKGQKKYPWSGTYTRSGKRKVRGDQLANFKQGEKVTMVELQDGLMTVPLQILLSLIRQMTLDCMTWQEMAAEWVTMFIIQLLMMKLVIPNYFRGNILPRINWEDGKAELVTPETQVFDTLANGRVMARKFTKVNWLKFTVDEKRNVLETKF